MKARLLLAEGGLGEATKIVRGGGIVAIPTDTVYGLASDPFNPAAAQRLYEAKGRDAKPVSLLCSDSAVAERLVVLGRTGRALALAHWPGALTIVAPMKKRALESVAPVLHQNTGWLGVRVPDSPFTIQLSAAVGGCVTGTSANLSRRPPCRTAGEVAASLGDRIDGIVDGGTLAGTESTVVRVAGEGVEVLRRGPIAIEQGRITQEISQTP